jgi:hypothetical protein
MAHASGPLAHFGRHGVPLHPDDRRLPAVPAGGEAPVRFPLKEALKLQRWQFGASEDDGGVAAANGGWHGREP